MGENRDIFNGIPENSVVLNAVNISEDLLQEHWSVIENRNNWHAFLIHNVKRTERNAILKIVLDHVYPEALLPSLFQSRGTDCIFLARNCSGAIGILLKNKLVIPDPSDRTWIYTCEIILMYSTIFKLPLPSNNISKILELLYDEKSKILNLTNFSDNKDLSEYSPLSQPKLLCFALHLSDELKPSHIKLNDNEIRTLSPFVVLKGKSSLQKLDLRNNLIEDLEELNYLNNNLVELWLDGNPVCAKYDAFTYIKIVKKTLPMLEILDGVSISAHEFPVSQQFFFRNNKGFDLVDQFVSHFYSLYDNERKLLIDLYHPSAIFSMTTGNSKRSRTIERLQVYRECSRNIMSLMSPSKSVAIGNKKILNVLLKLPKTEHNTPGFSVDMIYYTESSAVISITGTFVEDFKRNIQPDFVFDFKRTFTIIKRSSDYVIYNDVLHVDIASDQAKNHEVDVTAHGYRECEKRMAQEAMSLVTGVDKEWVKRLLEDADYNINKFLKSFMSLLIQNKIPELAYSQNSEHSLMEWLIPKMEEYGLEKFESSLQKEAQEYIRKTRSSQKMSRIPSISNQKRECSKIPENASMNVIKTPSNSDNCNHISEYPEKKCQIISKNTYKRKLIEIEETDFIEFETKQEIKSREEIVDITSTSGTSKCAAVDDADKNQINYNQGHRMTYENKHLLLATLCDKIFSTPQCSPQKNPRLYYKTLLTNLVEALQGLTALGQSLEACDFLVVYVITKHLDLSTREKWESQLGSSTESPPLSKLMDFLQAHTRSLEWLEEPEDSSKSSTSKSETSYAHAVASNVTSSKASTSKVSSEPVASIVPPRVVDKGAKSPQRPVRSNGLPSYNCDDCGDEHFIAKCSRYHNRNPSDRFEVVNRRQLCYNCLGRHNVRSCRNTQTCRLCSSRHHSSLHDHLVMTVSSRTPQASSSRPTTKASEAKPATSKRA